MGTGTAPYTADVAVQDGRIGEISNLSGAARERADADGALVTPGFVDVHTHDDGQVTWDDALEPSASNVVTTLVMRNCGVGFTPVRPTDHNKPIDLMEGVAGIPGSAPCAAPPRKDSSADQPAAKEISISSPPPVRATAWMLA